MSKSKVGRIRLMNCLIALGQRSALFSQWALKRLRKWVPSSTFFTLFVSLEKHVNFIY